VIGLLRHRYLRRGLTLPVLFGVFLLLVTALPLWVLAAAAISPRLPGAWRPLRWLWVAAVYLVLQVIGVIVVGVLWVASGLGYTSDSPRFVNAHYRVLAVLLDLLMRAVQWAFKLRLTLAAPMLPEDQSHVERGSRPLLVLSRHAGPGDSLLLVHELLSVYGRRPRIVLKASLQWDPLFDMLLNRVPTRFIPPDPGAGSDIPAMIGELAEDLTADDALVIFPEGGNYTERRRQRGIERLEASGHAGYAARARAMRHVMAPRPGGAFAAIDAAPDADVMFVAHSGLEHLTTVRDVWRGLPMHTDVRAEFWVVPREDIPEDPESRMDWLYRAWERMDAWIADRG
jgi:1-acyl-sn-glycerol-3-phosphate acyltransferase